MSKNRTSKKLKETNEDAVWWERIGEDQQREIKQAIVEANKEK